MPNRFFLLHSSQKYCELAIFFWIMPNIVRRLLPSSRESALLFSFELCLWCGMATSLGLLENRTLAIFFWIMRLVATYWWQGGPLLLALAIFFWIMLPWSSATMAKNSITPACYFLLNYAQPIQAQAYTSRRFELDLLFSFELCLVVERWYRQGPSYIDLLFSFELCRVVVLLVAPPHTLERRCRRLAIFFWIMLQESSYVHRTAPQRTCYFLLNYALWLLWRLGSTPWTPRLAIFFWIMLVSNPF